MRTHRVPYFLDSSYQPMIIWSLARSQNSVYRWDVILPQWTNAIKTQRGCIIQSTSIKNITWFRHHTGLKISSSGINQQSLAYLTLIICLCVKRKICLANYYVACSYYVYLLYILVFFCFFKESFPTKYEMVIILTRLGSILPVACMYCNQSTTPLLGQQ